jgi:hypothetical protein
MHDITARSFDRHPSREIYAIGSHWGGADLIDARRKRRHLRNIYRLSSSAIYVPPDIPGKAFSPADQCSAVSFDAEGQQLVAGIFQGLL